MKRLSMEQLDNLDAIKFKLGASGILLDNIPELILMAREAVILRDSLNEMMDHLCESTTTETSCSQMWYQDVADDALAAADALWDGA